MDGDIKYGTHGKSKSFDRRSRTETVHTSSFGDDSMEKMMIVGKGFGINKSKGASPGFHLHQCYSDSSVNPSMDGSQHKDSFPTEGYQLGLSDHPSASSISFASAISDCSAGVIQKRLNELESEMSGKDATISFLRKQLNLSGDRNVEFTSVAVETDSKVAEEEYQLELRKLHLKIETHEKTITELSRELEENIKLREKHVEENKNLRQELSLLNKQFHTMCEPHEGSPDIDFIKLEELSEQVAQLEESVAQKDSTIAELEEMMRRKEEDVHQKEKLISQINEKFLDFKNSSALEITELNRKLVLMEKNLTDQENLLNDKLKKAEKTMKDEIVTVAQKLEAQHQEEVRNAVERCRSGFKKLSELPKTRIEKVLKLCETGKFDVMMLQNDWEDQKVLLEKKVNALKEEKSKEINRLIEGYESKIMSLKSQIESLNQQLKERKETLDTFENELKMYRNEKARAKENREGDCNFKELKQLHAAEILSQQEKHKLEKALLQDKVKRLSEEILSHANNEKIHLQELQSAKLMASTFREKYEHLVAELEEKINLKKATDHCAMVNELDLEESVSQFRCLITSLKKAEEIHDSKIKFLKKLDQDEVLLHQREMNLFKVKLEQVDRFKTRLLELDNEIKELIKTVESKYASAVQSLTSYHISEVKLKQLEMDSMEKQNANEVHELRRKMKELSEANEALEKEIRVNKENFEMEMRGLKDQAEQLAVELLRNEGMLAVKTEIEETLTNRISQLENLIEIKNENSQKELESALSKCMTAEAMLSAKEEVAKEYEARIRDNERLLEKSNEQVDDIEKKCVRLEESFRNLEMMTQIILDMNNCENYFNLKKKMDYLELEFNEVSQKSKDLETECCDLSKINSTLVIEKRELSQRYREMKDERDKILENYKMIEDEMNKVMERSRNFENELNKIMTENKLVEEKCNDIIQKNCNESEAGSLLDKIERIGDHLGKTLDKMETERKEMIRCASDEIQKRTESFEEERNEARERERSLLEERDVVLSKNNILRENIRTVSEKVDYLLSELAKDQDPRPGLENEALVSDAQFYEMNDLASEDISRVMGQSGNASSETLKYILRCDILSRENNTLKRENDGLKTELKEMEREKMNELERIEMRNSFRDEMMSKLENIQKEVSEVINEKNCLIKKFETLEEERNRLKEELEAVRESNEAIARRFAEDESDDVPNGDSPSKMEANGLKKEVERLLGRVKVLTKELDLMRRDNEKLVLERRHHLKSNRCLKNELEEAWSQRYEIENQLEKLRGENAVLNLHLDQLEQTNKRISNLMAEGTPSVVSWMKIHETVENIVDVVQALKTSFTDLSPDAMRAEQLKSKSDSRPLPGTLHIELESKTKLCQELNTQKVMLEKELASLEKLMRRSESSQGQSKTEGRGRHGGHSRPESQSKAEYDSAEELVPDPGVSLIDKRIEMLEQEQNESYLETLHKLKEYFDVQVQLQDAQLTEALTNEIEGLKREIRRPKGGEDEECCPGPDFETDLDELKRKHREEVESLNRDHEVELEKLREILKEMRETGSNSLMMHEIESKHSEQMEELRRYFEKKCAELEKNFSEEVFTQQSRKMSNGSEATATDDLIHELGDAADGRDDVVEKYRTLLDREEDDSEKKRKFLGYITDIVKGHAEELNCLRTKYSKEMANLQRRHSVEIGQIREELQQLREKFETEKETMVRDYEDRRRKMAEGERKVISADLESRFDGKVQDEVRVSNELRLESSTRDEEESDLEESYVEKLNMGQMESTPKKIGEGETERRIGRRSEERFRRELEEEKMKIAQHYRDLNEAALRRFNEEQENLIKSHSDIMHRLIQEHEQKISNLKRAHKQDLERFHWDEETKLALEFRNKEKKFERELSSMKDTYEDELCELKKCCQDTLNEQVSLAKADAFNTLQKQIQDYLNGEDEENLTSREVIELGEKFAGKYRREIEELKERHQGEVTRIRTEYEERIRRRYSTGSLPKRTAEKMEMKTDDDKLQILRERDTLQEMVSSLRHVLSELIHYVATCEDELNNTIVGEFAKDDETMYKSFQMDTSELNETDCSSLLSRKVHLAPDLSDILNEINDSRSLNTTMQVRVELDRCLKQLKNDATHLLALSNPARKQDQNLYDLLMKIEGEKSRLEEKVLSMEKLQSELRNDLNRTKGKLAEFERTREVVSEGYGEEMIDSARQENLRKLKEKAKLLMGHQGSQPSDVLQVLDEICKEGDRLQEEARRERNDLQQQVDAADKQLRATRKFLEEQAAEREMERDDYMNEIRNLKEALKVRERDKSLQDRRNQEIENLESQLGDANAKLLEVEKSKSDVENQLKEAVDKIWTLREIIRELETQVAAAGEQKAALHSRIDEIEAAHEEQSKINRELMMELESFRSQASAEYTEHIKNMEEELSALRTAADRLSPEAVYQMKLNLREIELALSKKIEDLEQLHIMSSANLSCSSPSEDITMCERLDLTGCPTPDEMEHCGDLERVALPIEEINRINEKLIRHTRAEEVAIKTVRDLKTQLKNSRKALEEIQIERDVLLERSDSYLQENSKLKVRLDEQRCNAGIIQKQLSADLEAQIERLHLELEKLKDLCIQKDKQIRDMSVVLEQTTKSLKIREAEVLNKSNEENEVIVNLKTELHNALEEKKSLEESVTKMKDTIRETVTVPFLIDSMLEEKNAEIDRLEKEVARLSKQRAMSSLIRSHSSSDSANSSKSLKRVKFSEPDSFVQFVSPILPENESVARCASDSYADLKISSQKLRKPNDWASTPESMSSIGPLQLSPRGIDSHLHWSGSSHLQMMSSPKEPGHTEDLESLRRQLSEKSDVIKKYESELSQRSAVDAEIDEIRVQLKTTMDAVEQDKSLYRKEFERLLESETKLKSELDGKKREISEHLLEIDTLKRKLADLSLELETCKADYQKLESDLATKDGEVRTLKSNAESLLMTMETLKKNHLEEVEELQSKLNFEHGRVESVLGELKILEVKKVEIEEEFLSLKDDYNEKLTSQQRTVANLRGEIAELERKNRELSEEYDKLDAQMVEALAGANKLSRDLTEELHVVKKENDKLRGNKPTLKRDLESSQEKVTELIDVETQAAVDAIEEECQTSAIGGSLLRQAEADEEVTEFQVKIDKLKMEMLAWEQKMNEREFEKEEAMSYAAIVRTLVSCIVDSLDDHFYELQTYRKKMMECSVDDLTAKVQKELMLSAKLDNKLLSNFQSEDLGQSEVKYLSDCLDQTTVVEDGGGDNNLSAKKQNLVNLTVKLYELETNLQEMEQRNKEFEAEMATLRQEKDGEKSRAEGLEILVKLLEDGLAKEKAKLAEEKSRYDEDAKIMEVLRVNFELFVEKVDELERALSIERQHRMTLETMLKNPAESAESSVNAKLKCDLELERQKCISLGVNVEKEKKKCHELRLQLEREKLERMTEKDVQRMLNKDVALLQEQKDNLETQLSFARDLLQTRQSEIAALKRKINLQEIDIKALAISNESQHEKEAEMSVMAERMSELEKELEFYRKQMQELSDKSENISAPLLMKMKVLSNCVQQHVQESNEMGEALFHLTQETEQMRSLIKKIEESTESSGGATMSSASDETIIADIEAERKLWKAEKEHLTAELEKAKFDYEVLKKDSMEVFKSNDLLKLEAKKQQKEIEVLREEVASAGDRQIGIPEDRVFHLFGKYMRTESFRKALAYQKMYLTSVLNGYDGGVEEALVKLSRGGSSRRREVRRKHSVRSKRRSLKLVALVVIAIKRMQFMVVRWRICRLTAFNSLMGPFDQPTANKENECRRPLSGYHPGPIDPLRFQTHNLLRQQRAQSNVLRTPPSRDPDTRLRPLDTRKINENIERFNHLQKNLGLPSRPP